MKKKGVVKKCGVLKIIHDKFKSAKKNEAMVKEMVESFNVAKEFNKELEPLIARSHEVLNPLKVLFLFKNIPCEVSTSFLVIYSKPLYPDFFNTSLKRDF